MSLSFATAGLLVLLLAISWIDARQMIIPDELNGLLAVGGVAVSVSFLGNSWLTVLWQSTAVFALMWALANFYERIRKVRGLGGGDVKFLSAATCWVGLLGLPWVVLIASLSGLTHAAISHLMGHFKTSQRLPFGPHLALGLFVTWMLRNELFNFQI